MKGSYFFGKKKKKNEIVYDLTFILHRFSVSIQKATHYFYAPVLCTLFYWRQGRKFLGELGTDTNKTMEARGKI